MNKNINKRVCRKYADPGYRFSKSGGLFHNPQIKYVVRAAVKNIDGARTLLLYLYAAKAVAEGRFVPQFTVFQTKTDFITLECLEDGSSKWRTATTNYLERSYCFTRSCAFYSLQDEQAVMRFCKGCKDSGFGALSHLQDMIYSQKALERRHAKERRIISRMDGIPALPRDLKGWVHREVLAHYLFYDYHKGKSPMAGYCTACRHEVEVTGAKHNTQGVCPRCKKSVVFKSRGRRGYLRDRNSIQVVQKLATGELLIRVLKVYCDFRELETPELSIYEATRIFAGVDASGDFYTEPYYHSYFTGDLTPWKTGYCPVRYMYQENFFAGTCCQLYCRNLDEVLRGTPWQYCQLKPFYLTDRAPLEAAPYFKAFYNHPKLEMLFKLGFRRLTSDLVYRVNPSNLLDRDRMRPHEIMRVWPEDVAALRSADANAQMLEEYQKYRKKNIRPMARDQMLGWMEHWEIDNDYSVFWLMQYMSFVKLRGYMEKQYARLHKNTKRYQSMLDILDEYRDYLRMCDDERYDLADDFILFPKNLMRSHDRLSKMIEFRVNTEHRRKFRVAYRAVISRLDFEKDGLKIVYPKKPEDIASEGTSLHHCVGGYVSDVIEKKTMILFLRQSSDPETSFYTIEVRDGKVTQVRGLRNCRPTPEVESFMAAWEKEVLYAPVAAAA